MENTSDGRPLHSIIIHGKTIMGLSQKKATDRFLHDGPNELPSQKRRNTLLIFIDVIKEPMLLLLLACGGLYFLLGEAGDAVMLMTFVLVVIGITFFQERKTERALEALKNLSSPRATVIRDGKRKKIAGREVVVDDVLFLAEGDRVPADGVMLSAVNMTVDESLLTGEAMPVRKIAWDKDYGIDSRPGGDDLPFVYSGSLVSSGHGIMHVIHTGAGTQMGKIGTALATIEQEEMLLQKETKKLVSTFGLFGGLLCVSVILLYGLSRGNWIEGILAGLTLSMAMLPEEFSVVLLIFLAIGAWRISKRNVLTRKLPAIETLGAATVLCVDKTGTLTHNKMSLRAVSDGNKIVSISEQIGELPEDTHGVIEYGLLASQRDPFDPFEKEIKRIADGWLLGTEHIHNNWTLVGEYPLTRELLALSHVWQSPDKKDYQIAAKGAPEAILDLCHVTKDDWNRIERTIQQMASDGLRVLAVARASFTKSNLPKLQHDFEFSFVGLVGFVDPVRETVPQAVKTAYEAGMKVVMITGDYPITAQHIARQIGLSNPNNYVTGKQLSTMDKDQLQQAIVDVNIFARVVPEQKLAIVNAYKAIGEIVAMTGDGVNDAPALKAAHIGIAMGERGTDVAREAASLVLLDDDFTSIIEAVRLGRRIFDNLRKAMAYILSIHIPIAGLSFLPIVFGMPTLLLPAHIAFLELIIDPACSIVFESEPEEDDVMKRKPRKLTEPMVSRATLMVSLLQGFSVLFVILGLYTIYTYIGKGSTDARTLAFVSLVLSNILLIILNLSWRKSIISVLTVGNAALLWVSFGALVALFSVLYFPPLQSIFRFSVFHLDDWALAVAGSVISLLWFEILKYLRMKKVISVPDGKYIAS